MANRPIKLQKRLLQFNGVPFAYGELTDSNYSIVTKGDSQTYTNNAHGAYFPTFGEYAKLEPTTYTTSLDINFKKLACEDKIRYAKFIKRQFMQSGKLWAIQNGVELIWQDARVTQITESKDQPNERDLYRIDVTFELLNGYWTMAKDTRTFLCEYCPNRFEDFDPKFCFDAHDYYGVCTDDNNCLPCDINLRHEPEYQACEWKPLCEFPLYNKRKSTDRGGNRIIIPSRYDMFGVNCANQWYINYNCDLEKERFCYDQTWGRRFNLDSSQPNNSTTFEFCAQTDMPTTNLRIRLVGSFRNPTITINGDTIKVKDPETVPVFFDGIMTVGFGSRIKIADNEKRDPSKITRSVENLFSRSNTPMFELQPGNNTITVTGNVRGESAQVYIDERAITW